MSDPIPSQEIDPAALADALAIRLTRYVTHVPTPKQHAFLWLPHREAFYGGAAGGGKSDALLMAALQHVDIPGYAAILFRRTYKDLALPGALMDRSQEWLRNTDAKWVATESEWRFPSGAKITFGYLEHEKDKFRYRSAEFQFIGFDELTDFSETQFTFLFSRLRRLKGFPVPIRMRCASNPGGVGHDWVNMRYNCDGRSMDTKAVDRPFIAAGLDDNPYLDTEEYELSLMELDPVTRLQLRHGDWTVAAGGGRFRREWWVVREALPAKPLKYLRFWDLAATEPLPGTDPDWTAGVLMARSRDDEFFIVDVVRERLTSGGIQKLVKQTAKIDGRKTTIVVEQEPGASGKQTVATYKKLLTGYPVWGERSTGSKEERADSYAAQAEAGNVILMRAPWNIDFIGEHTQFPTGPHDDMVDAASGAFKRLTSGRRTPTQTMRLSQTLTRTAPWEP